ncbi:MAG: hypothetical protein JXA38_05625, partial [Methanosarcinaceae archaeon]|nr:hypothetical protein [Methanosarcinaceae archaeon]
MNIDRSIIDDTSLKKLEEINNSHVNDILEKYVKLCKPAKVTVLDDSEGDRNYVRDLALKTREEMSLKTEGHTIHFDGMQDQGRDLENTRVLLPRGKKLSKAIETIDSEEGLKEIFGLLNGIMEGKEMLLKFYCLGPQNSKFSIPALQLTDS